MPPLNITKVAFGCTSLDILTDRMVARGPGEIRSVTTRYRPTRHADLIGGSLYWIIKHRLVARQRILGFAEVEGEKRWIIRLDAALVPVRAQPRRAHQGWRYLTGADAPADFDASDADLAALPPDVLNELAALALI